MAIAFRIDFSPRILFFNELRNAKLHFSLSLSLCLSLCVEKFFVLIGIVGVAYQVVGVIFSLRFNAQKFVKFGFFRFFFFCSTHSSSMRCRCLTSSDFFFLWCIFAYFVYLVNVCFLFYSLARFLNLSNQRIQPIPSD